MRLALVFAVVAVAVVLSLWALGFVGGSEALDGSGRALALVGIGAAAAAAARILLSSGRPADPGDAGPPGNGPRF